MTCDVSTRSNSREWVEGLTVTYVTALRREANTRRGLTPKCKT